jgi:hypothetical protein
MNEYVVNKFYAPICMLNFGALFLRMINALNYQIPRGLVVRI